MDHPRPSRHPLRAVAAACAVTLVTAWAPAVWAANAEIVMLVGKGERRPDSAPTWQPAAVSQKLAEGDFVRTASDSQMAIFMPDRTQIRLNQNSQLQVKTVAEATSFSESLVRLNAGRAWSQARPQTGGGGAALARARVVIQTPTATLGIRGTDWDVEVDPEGRTQLVVLSGVVSMANDFGSVDVAPGEAATAEAGKAPVKRVLVNARERVQWVSSWRPAPRRWAGTDSARLAEAVSQIEAGSYTAAAARLRPGAAADASQAVLLADLLLYQGDAADARNVLAGHARDGQGDARAIILLAQALAREDKLDESTRLLAAALARAPGQAELLIAQGDIAVLAGDAATARAAYAQAAAAEPGNSRAWYGLGLISSERENVRQARTELAQAVQLQPDLSAARAEQAAVETFAGNLAEGRSILTELLAREPDNYQALTALGLNRLKSGQPAAALEDFMKAGVIEPRYARAWLYQSVAFYQLGQRDRAEQALRKAAELDTRDPMPHLYASVVAGDALDYGAAIESARAAQQRMPYLRSLNQAASNQKGSANLGASLANFGLEEWAGYYATEAYSPYWGGSHLFLADRYTGKFNKNSELFTGFLTEPLAFGASNRESSLVAAPGSYARAEFFMDRRDWTQLAAIGTVNGMRVEPTPIAYYLRADVPTAEARHDASTAHGSNLTVGLGIKPQYDVGLFGFATDARINAALRTPDLPSDAMKQTENRADLGMNYKLAAENQFWVKAGRGKQQNDVSGALVSQSTADALNQAFGTTSFLPNGTLDVFQSSVEQSDAQFRHAFTSGQVQWTWGAERSRQTRTGQLGSTFTPVRLDVDQRLEVRATDVYGSALYRESGRYDLQFDLFSQHVSVHREDANTLQLQLVPPQNFTLVNTVADQTMSEVNPRIGVKWQLAPLQSVRAVYQKWRRPASSATLAPLDTVGVVVNDRLVSAGGLYERARLQFDGELGGSRFVQVFADRERIDNGLGGQRTAISDFEVSQLEALKNRPEVFSARPDLEETPQFPQGRINSLGLSLNQLLGRNHTLSLRYVLRDAHQTGANDGLAIPYVPRHFLSAGAQWALPGKWLLGTTAIYRSERFKDDANTERLAGGWSLGLSAYWESADKRHSVQALLDNLLSNKAAAVIPDAHFVLRYAYSF